MDAVKTHKKLTVWKSRQLKKAMKEIALTRTPYLEVEYEGTDIPNLKIFSMEGEEADFVERAGGGALYVNLGWVGVIFISTRKYEGNEELLGTVLLHEEGHHVNRDRRYRGWLDLQRKEIRADAHAIGKSEDGKKAARLLLSQILTAYQGWKKAWVVLLHSPRMVHLMYRLYSG